MNYVRFVGREKELKMLNHIYSTEKFEFAVIYCRYRVGKQHLLMNLQKTALLNVAAKKQNRWEMCL